MFVIWIIVLLAFSTPLRRRLSRRMILFKCFDSSENMENLARERKSKNEKNEEKNMRKILVFRDTFFYEASLKEEKGAEAKKEI